MSTREAIQMAIKIAGGAKELAEKVGVSYKSVLDWNSGRTGISIGNCIKIERATNGKVKKEEIMPDFPWKETK